MLCVLGSYLQTKTSTEESSEAATTESEEEPAETKVPVVKLCISSNPLLSTDSGKTSHGDCIEVYSILLLLTFVLHVPYFLSFSCTLSPREVHWKDTRTRTVCRNIPVYSYMYG